MPRRHECQEMARQHTSKPRPSFFFWSGPSIVRPGCMLWTSFLHTSNDERWQRGMPIKGCPPPSPLFSLTWNSSAHLTPLMPVT